MKKILTGLFCLMIGIVCYAQAPQAFSYQAVAIGDNGGVLDNTDISVRVNINEGNPAGNAAYIETHEVTTSDAGLFSLEVGLGTPENGVFSEIDWSTSAYFLSVEVDENGTGNYQNIGISQLLSVPYALYAEGGTPGPTGPIGETGDKGPKGNIGPVGASSGWCPQGPAGPAGAIGPPGERGIAGGSTHCWDLNDNLQDDPEEDINQDGVYNASDCVGLQGPAGEAGPEGPPGVDSNIQGPPGEAGPVGPNGPIGEQGPKGEKIECSPWTKDADNVSYSGPIGVGTFTPNCALDVSGEVSSYGITLSSDLRYKENIVSLEEMLEKVLELEGVNYLFKTGEFSEKDFSEQLQVGLIAQEVEKVFPDLVITKADGYKAVNYSKLSPILLEALRSLNVEMENEDQYFSNQYELLNTELENLKAVLSNNQ